MWDQPVNLSSSGVGREPNEVERPTFRVGRTLLSAGTAALMPLSKIPHVPAHRNFRTKYPFNLSQSQLSLLPLQLFSASSAF